MTALYINQKNRKSDKRRKSCDNGFFPGDFRIKTMVVSFLKDCKDNGTLKRKN